MSHQVLPCIIIGGSPYGNYMFKGKIYEAALWTKASWWTSSASNPTIWGTTAAARYALVQSEYAGF